MIDHDTDSYQKIARAFVDKQPSGNLTREHIVDNITLYWLTGTGASAARSYWEEGQENARAAGQAPTPVSVPVGFTTFPGEIWRTPRSWVERAYPERRHLLQRGRQGRPLRRLGRTGALLGRVARRVPAAALADSGELGVRGRPRERVDLRDFAATRRSLPTARAVHRVTPASTPGNTPGALPRRVLDAKTPEVHTDLGWVNRTYVRVGGGTRTLTPRAPPPGSSLSRHDGDHALDTPGTTPVPESPRYA